MLVEGAEERLRLLVALAREWILAIETSNPSAAGAGVGVALGRMDGSGPVLLEPLAARGEKQARGGLDDDLMPAIDRIMRRAGVGVDALARVAVSAGPGGYTGLRVACAAGKMIAEGCGCACVAVRSARAALVSSWDQIATRGTTGVAVLLASKGESSWGEVFLASDNPLEAHAAGPGGLIGPGEVSRLKGVGVLLGDQFVAGSIIEAAKAAGMQVLSPKFDAQAVLKLGMVGEAIDPAGLSPMYPREPDAVTLWRARHSGGETQKVR